MKTEHTNKYVYNLIQKNKIRPEKKSEVKWTEQLMLDWKLIYTTSLQATKDIKLQNFNDKFLMRIIPTNRYLLKCNIGHTALCDFCSMDIETLNHLFWECIQVQQFWTNLSILMQEYNVHIKYNLRYILLGITGKKSNRNSIKKLHNFAWEIFHFQK